MCRHTFKTTSPCCHISGEATVIPELRRDKPKAKFRRSFLLDEEPEPEPVDVARSPSAPVSLKSLWLNQTEVKLGDKGNGHLGPSRRPFRFAPVWRFLMHLSETYRKTLNIYCVCLLLINFLLIYDEFVCVQGFLLLLLNVCRFSKSF